MKLGVIETLYAVINNPFILLFSFNRSIIRLLHKNPNSGLGQI